MCCDSWGRKESDTTERLNYTEVSFVYFYFHYSRGWVKKDFAVIYVKECSSYGFLQEFYGVWSYI